MDGTIIDSTDAIVKFWRQLGKDIGVDGDCMSLFNICASGLTSLTAAQ